MFPKPLLQVRALRYRKTEKLPHVTQPANTKLGPSDLGAYALHGRGPRALREQVSEGTLRGQALVGWPLVQL